MALSLNCFPYPSLVVNTGACSSHAVGALLSVPARAVKTVFWWDAVQVSHCATWMLINTPSVGSQSAAWWPAGYPTTPRGGLIGIKSCIYRKQAGRYEALPLPRPMKGAQILSVSDGGGIPPERPSPITIRSIDVRRATI